MASFIFFNRNNYNLKRKFGFLQAFDKAKKVDVITNTNCVVMKQ